MEADGALHDARVEHDAERDRRLTAEGFCVLRFPNQQIESRGHEVVAAILAAVDARVVGG